MTSLKEDVRRSAMLCILTVPATMTSHDLMKFVAPFNEVIEQMKIIRDSTPNQYMVLIKFSAQVKVKILKISLPQKLCFGNCMILAVCNLQHSALKILDNTHLLRYCCNSRNILNLLTDT